MYNVVDFCRKNLYLLSPLILQINMKTSFKINFRVSYVILGLLIVTLLGLWIFFNYYPSNEWTPSMLDVMAYCTGSVAILTLIYHSLNLQSSQNMHKQNLKIRKNQYSFDIVSKVHETEMANNLNELRKMKVAQSQNLKEKNIKEFVKFLDENPTINSKVSQLLNYFEHVSILIEVQHVDEIIIKSAFKTLFTSTYSMLKFYIDEKQLQHRTTWITYENLSKKWSVE